jgi:hypothetical protein
MGALLDQFAAEGVQIEASGEGKLRAVGKLTDATRALIRVHKSEILAELAANDPVVDPGVERRRARALAMLDADPNRRLAVVAEAGNSAHITVAIRGVAVGELTIPAERYDGFALLALMQQYGNA